MVEEKNIPTCVGFILDGNRRWAKERGLPTIEGHKKGYEKLKETVSWCKDEGIQHAVVYAFSTENWNRSEEEVGYLMDLMRLVLKTELHEIREDGSAIHLIGDTSLFPEDIQGLVQDMHASNPDTAQRHVWIAASYGGRAEILAGVNKLLKEGKQEVTEEEFLNSLWTHDMPDPEIIIRTGGNKRLSNFLTWSSVYSELFFLDTFWPDFSKEELTSILEEFSTKKPNFGV